MRNRGTSGDRRLPALAQRSPYRARWSPRAGGFSLVEILIVICLIALVVMLMVPGMNSAFRTSIESFTRETALLLAQARDRALLADKLIRLHIDLDKQVYVLEEAPSSYMLQKPPEHALTGRELEEQQKKEADAYAISKALMDKPRDVPKGLRIIEVRTPRQKDPIKEGTVDIFFFNNGSADAATIYFQSDEKVHTSLKIHPVTGQCRISAKSPEDDK